MTSMTPKSAFKIVPALSPADYAATAPTATQCLNIDTKGFRWATFVLHIGALTGTSFAAKVQESSDNFSADAAADITGAVFTTATGAGSDDSLMSLTIDLSKTERYLQLAFTFSSLTVSLLSAVCILSNALDTKYLGTNGVDATALGPYPT